jgi:hypothetical protein
VPDYRILVTGSRDFDDAALLAYRLGLAVGYGLTRGWQVTGSPLHRLNR